MTTATGTGPRQPRGDIQDHPACIATPARLEAEAYAAHAIERVIDTGVTMTVMDLARMLADAYEAGRTKPAGQATIERVAQAAYARAARLIRTPSTPWERLDGHTRADMEDSIRTILDDAARILDGKEPR